MSVHRRGKFWSYEFEFRGQRIRKSTRSTSKSLAERAERKHRRDLEESANGLAPAYKPKLFAKASKEWLESNKAHWSRSNLKIQEFNLKHLSGYFKTMLIGDVTAVHIGNYQLTRKNAEAANRTINMEVATLRQILKAERLWAAVAADVRMLRESTQIGKALTPDEEARLLESCRNSPSPSLFPAVVIFCNTGLRNAELRCARWRQVDFLRVAFCVGSSKTAGGAGRVIPLNHIALKAFKDWRSCHTDAKPDDFIFPSEKLVFKGEGSADRGLMTGYGMDRSKPLGSWKTAWGTAKRTAGVECRIHDLRHHFISALAHTQTPDVTIKALSGHISPEMLAHYSHVRLDAMRKAVDLLGESAEAPPEVTAVPRNSDEPESVVPTKVPTAEDVN